MKEIILEDIDVKDISPVEIVVNDYNKTINKPKINNVELIGNKTSQELKLQDEMVVLSNLDIEKLLN